MVGLFTNLTTKSGEELTDYKKKLIELNATFAGGLSLIGRNASESGTTIKTFTTKMIALEERAKKLFDADTANLYYDSNTKAIVAMEKGARASTGVFKINSDYLSKLSKEDLPQATEMLSKLTVQQKISQETLNKMFTIWNSPFTSSVLHMMGGDLQAFNEAMDSGRTVLTDYQLKMKDLNNQLAIIKNNIDALGVGFLDYGRDLIGVTGTVTSALKDLSKANQDNPIGAINDTLFKFGMTLVLLQGLKTGAGALLDFKGLKTAYDEAMKAQKAMIAVNAGLTASQNVLTKSVLSTKGAFAGLSVFLKANAFMLAITGVITLLSLWEKYDRQQREVTEKRKRDEDVLRSTIQTTNLLKRTTDGYTVQIKALSTTDISQMWSKSYSFLKKNLDAITKIQEELSVIKTSTNSWENSLLKINSRSYDMTLSDLKTTQNKKKAYEILIPLVRKFYQEQGNAVNKQNLANSSFEEYVKKSSYAKTNKMGVNPKELAKQIEIEEAIYTLGIKSLELVPFELNKKNEYNNLVAKELVLKQYLADEDKKRQENASEYYKKQAEEYQLQINSIIKITDILNQMSDATRDNAIKNLFSDTTIKTVDEFKNKFESIFGVESLSGITKIENALSGIQGAFVDKKLNFSLFKNENIQNSISQLETLKNIQTEFNTKLKDTRSELEIQKDIKDATGDKLLALQEELTIRENLNNANSKVEEEIKRIRLLIPYYEKLWEQQEQINSKLRERNILLSDSYEKSIRSFEEYNTKDTMAFFGLKSENIKKDFERTRDEILNERDNLIIEAQSSKSEFKIFDFNTAKENELKTEYSLLEANKSQSQEAYKKYENFAKYYDLWSKYKASFINQSIEESNNNKDNLSYYLQTIQANKDIDNLYASQEQLLNSELDMARLQQMYAVGDLENARALLNVKKAEKNLEDYKYERRLKLLSINREMNLIGADDIKLEIEELNLLENKYAKEADYVKRKEYELELEKKKYEIMLKQVGVVTDLINSMAKGDKLSPSYDSGILNKGILNLLQRKSVSAVQNAEMANFALTQFNNIYQRVNQAEVQKINRDIEMLEARKSLAKTDEERLAIENDILNKRIEAIKLEARASATQSILGGVTGGISTGTQVASSLAGLGVAGATPIGIGLGIISVIGGILGRNDAKKQAKIQEQQLKYQKLTSEATNAMVKLTNLNNTFLSKLYSGQNLGYEYSKKLYLEQVKKENKNAINLSGAISGNIQGAIKNLGDQKGFATQNEANWDALFGNDALSLVGIIEGTKGIKFKKEYVDDFLNTLQTDIGNVDFYSDTTSITNRINALKALWGDYTKTGDKANAYIANVQRLIASWENYLKVINEISQKKDVFYSAYFGFKIEEIKDEAGNITDIMRGEWEKRSEIMDKFVENAKTGSNDIASYMGDYTVQALINSWTRNRTSLKNVLNNIEDEMYNLGTFMSENADKNFTSLMQFSTFTPRSSTKHAGYDEYNPIKNLVLYYNELSAEQTRVNEQSANFLKIWREAGGKISDVQNMFSDMQKGLYNSFLSAVQAEDMLSGAQEIGSYFGEQIGKSMAESVMNNQLADSFTSISNMMTSAIDNIGQNGIINFNVVSQTAQEIRKSMAEVELQRQQLQVATDLLTYQGGDYTSANQQINYETGSTKNNVYNTYNNVAFEIGNAVASDSAMRELADELIGYLEESTRNSSLKF